MCSEQPAPPVLALPGPVYCYRCDLGMPHVRGQKAAFQVIAAAAGAAAAASPLGMLTNNSPMPPQV